MNLVQCTEAALTLTAAELRRRACVVQKLDPVAPVRGYPGRIGQVIVSLLVNAAQAIPEKSTRPAEIRVATRMADDDRVVVEVSDTGTGIAPEVLKRIFEPFFTTKPRGVGTGLGLALAKRAVSEMGGDILCESALGTGTTFRVISPAVQPLDSRKPHARRPARPAGPAAVGGTAPPPAQT